MSDIEQLMAAGGKALIATSEEINTMLEALSVNTKNMAEMVTAITMLSSALALSVTPSVLAQSSVEYQHKVLKNMAHAAGDADFHKFMDHAMTGTRH